jgi:hypothetical protein
MISSVLLCLRAAKAISFFVCRFTISIAVSQTAHLSAGQTLLVGRNGKVGMHFTDIIQSVHKSLNSST